MKEPVEAGLDRFLLTVSWRRGWPTQLVRWCQALATGGVSR